MTELPQLDWFGMFVETLEVMMPETFDAHGIDTLDEETFDSIVQECYDKVYLQGLGELRAMFGVRSFTASRRW